MSTTLPYRLVRSAALTALLVTGMSLSAAQTKQTDARRTNAQDEARQERNAGAREICIRVEMSGTRMPRRVCKTAQEWEAEGGVPGER